MGKKQKPETKFTCAKCGCKFVIANPDEVGKLELFTLYSLKYIVDGKGVCRTCRYTK